ncbi:MAG TPA: adenylyltransferase/cytidyltransferase family protein [Candidatus Paceibacterota bacterium]
MKKAKLVCVSGYFNPIHVGHIRLVQAAAKLGRVIVIVNNDHQVKLKGSMLFMPAKDRAEIMTGLAGVWKSVIAIDEDRTVCHTLAKIKPDIFCNGGDRTKNNIPELATCARLGIKVIFGVGGRKVRSSSVLINRAVAKVGL